MKSNIFKAYDVRGTYPDEVNTEVVFDVSNAAARYLNAKTIVVGEDGRNSSPELREAAIKGVLASGCNVLYIGRCTTPLFYFSVNKLNADGGIMVTASHNPPQYNGLKIVGRSAMPIAEDSGLTDIKNLIDKEFKAPNLGKIESADTLDDYVDEVIKMAGKFKILNNRAKPSSGLYGHLKIVIDAGNGVASITLKPLLKKLGLEYTPLYFDIDGSFPNHLSDISREENLRDLKEKVLQENADLGVAFDGDADRIFFIDKTGLTIRSDYVLALLYKFSTGVFRKPKVVYDLRFTKSVKEFFGSRGIRSKPGHTFVKSMMRKTEAGLGGELSGHFAFKEINYAESAVLVMLKIFKILNEEKTTIGEIIKPWQKYFNSGEINIEMDDSRQVLDKIKSNYLDGKIDELDGITIEYPNWWFNLRLSNTEPVVRLVVEADTKELMEEKKTELTQALSSL